MSVDGVENVAGQTLYVNSEEELNNAYHTLSSSGGGTIYLSSTFPSDGQISLSNGGADHVHITAEDPNDLAEISRIELNSVDNLSISHVHVDSSEVDRPEYWRDIDISQSSGIDITNSVFTSDGSQFYDPSDPNAVLGEHLMMVRSSSDITFSHNLVDGYEIGPTFKESTGIEVVGNEITGIQVDGIRLAGVQDVLIEDNYLHDFAASTNEYSHSDFIQLWSTGTEIVSGNINITGNTLDTGNDVSVQGIFLGNEVYSSGDQDHVYTNISVTDNLIYTGSANGIYVGQADGVVVDSNTVLWNQDAETIKATGNTSYTPRIVVHDDTTNAEITNNISTKIVHNGDGTVEGNELISWNPDDPNYVDNHFMNVAAGGDIGPAGWQLREDSLWVGKGASSTQPTGADETQQESEQAVEPEGETADETVDAEGTDASADEAIEEPAQQDSEWAVLEDELSALEQGSPEDAPTSGDGTEEGAETDAVTTDVTDAVEVETRIFDTTASEQDTTGDETVTDPEDTSAPAVEDTSTSIFGFRWPRLTEQESDQTSETYEDTSGSSETNVELETSGQQTFEASEPILSRPFFRFRSEDTSEDEPASGSATQDVSETNEEASTIGQVGDEGSDGDATRIFGRLFGFRNNLEESQNDVDEVDETEVVEAF